LTFLTFNVGQTVVHPHHGPAAIRRLATRQIRGEEIEYLVLEVQANKLEVWVPTAKAADVGLRPVLDSPQLEELMGVLRAPADTEEQQWSRRFKENTEFLASGRITDVARVVRNLTLRSMDKGLSHAERDMLRHARRPLLTEISLSLGVTEEEAAAVLDGVWAGAGTSLAEPVTSDPGVPA
jgi:CarD family transcriptional regulator